MISCLINKNSKAISKVKFEDHLREIENKKDMIYALLKETVLTEDPKTDSINSPLSTLCESYVTLLRMADLLSNMLINQILKNTIRFKSEEVIMYLAFYQNLIVYETELKHLFYISLTSRDTNV
jgi:hypothetical protein